MVWLAGVDGCPSGWIRASRDTDSGALAFGIFASIGDVVREVPVPKRIAIDIPIGLPESGARVCDREARRLLGPRRSSVFPAPIRPALIATSRQEANDITARIDGRGVSAQAFGIYAKVREVDLLLTSRPGTQRRLCEVHPELSFQAMNSGVPLGAPKKAAAGLAQRRALIQDWLGSPLPDVRGAIPRRDLADDDILDALATLWSAHRLESGGATTLPVEAPLDGRGLPMQISF